MSKELEAIRDNKLRIGLLGLKRLFEANAKKMTKDEIIAFDFTFMNITNALLELQAIKEAKPSEAMRELDDISYLVLNEIDDLKNKELWKSYFTNIKQALLQAENCLGARRNGKTLEQMYQLVQYSKAPMKPALWVAKIDGKLEQRVIMEKEEYHKLLESGVKELKA